MLKDFCTKNGIKLIVHKLQIGGVTLYRLNIGMIDLGFLEIQGNDFVEPLNEFFGKKAISRTDVKRLNTVGWK